MPEQIASTNKTRHIPQLDGLRGCAIILVLCIHYFSFIPVFSIGWSGVDLFFVLSGYLITGNLLRSRNQPGFFSNFYRNRLLRILPVYFGTLLLFFIGISFLTKEKTLPLLSIYFVHWKSFFFFTVNWMYIFSGIPKAPYLLHFWSLSVEEQFYLIWPALLFALPNYKKRISVFTVLIVLSIALRMVIYNNHQDPVDFHSYYFNTFCRIDSFIMGALIAEIHFNKIKISLHIINFILLLSCTVLIAGIVILKNAEPSNLFFGTFGYTIIAILFALIIYKAVLQPEQLISRFFTNRLLGYCGKISYGLYISHWPVLLVFENRMEKWGIGNISPNTVLVKWLSTFTCLALTFLISMLSFRYFESYFLKLKK